MNPTDNASIYNLVFTYTGAAKSGPLAIDGFSAVSTDGGTNPLGNFSYQAEKTADPLAPDQGLGPINVPTPASTAPEPGSLALIGGGLIVFALVGRRKFRT